MARKTPASRRVRCFKNIWMGERGSGPAGRHVKEYQHAADDPCDGPRSRESMERRKDDSLGELLIVIALLLIIAATAIPNLLRAAIADHESSAVSFDLR